MGRKKGQRETGMVRVYREFAEQAKQAAGERGLTIAEFCDRFLMAPVAKIHHEYIASEAKRIARPD